ncbi:Adenylate cyclase type 2-like 4, partial [Homarus americanus]
MGVGYLHPPPMPAHLTPPTFLLILATHTAVPLPRLHARILAVVLGYTLMMVAAHTLGWWLDWEAAHAHKHARSSTREVIEARVKLECEREQQEQ